MDLVESHVHIWTIRDRRYGAHPDSDTHPDIEAGPSELFKAQDEVGGVRWTVLIQPRYYLWDNTYLAQAATDFPDRFVVVGRVDPLAAGAADRLRELMQWPGYRGFRLAPNTDPEQWLDGADQDPLWTAAASTGATIGLLIAWGQLPQAAEMARRHPDVTIVIDHLGSPYYSDPSSIENLLRLADFPSVYVKLSGYPGGTSEGYPYRTTHPLIERVYGAFGADRLMWGTDWPVCLSRATYREAFESAWNLPFLSDDDRQWVFNGTARKAWRIDSR
jgi:L-fuconolactonase